MFFDNVGGGVLEAMLPLMAPQLKVASCAVPRWQAMTLRSMLSWRRADGGTLSWVINKALRLVFFSLGDFMPAGQALAQLAGWLQEGQLKTITKIWDGLDAAPEALVVRLAGETVGQVVVRVGPGPTRPNEDVARMLTPRS